MPPQEKSKVPSKQGIKWNEVTWYSKLGAIILFLAVVPALCFYIGTQYELTKKVFVPPVTVQNPVATVSLVQWVPISRLTDEDRWFEDRGKIYFKRYDSKILLSTAKPETFVVAVNKQGSSTLYAKDDTTAYRGDAVFHNVDLKSFTPIFFNQEDTHLSKDTFHVYNWVGDVIPNIDSMSIIAIGMVGGSPDGAKDEYFKDKNGIYFFDGSLIAEADIATFKALDSLEPAPYPGLSVASGGVYGAYDKNYKYYQDTIVATSSTNSVHTVVFPGPNGKAGIYMKDQNFVYLYGAIILKDADPPTFTVVRGQNTYDAEDRNHKYLQGKVVQ